MANTTTLDKEIEERGKPTVELSGQDGNVFMILGLCQKSLRRAGFSREAQEEWMAAAKASASYDGVIQTAMRYLDVE